MPSDFPALMKKGPSSMSSLFSFWTLLLMKISKGTLRFDPPARISPATRMIIKDISGSSVPMIGFVASGGG